jgi:hypothetical protein
MATLHGAAVCFGGKQICLAALYIDLDDEQNGIALRNQIADSQG